MHLSKEWKQSLTMLAIGAVILAILVIPGRLEKARCDAFGRPLFDHPLPQDAVLVSANAVEDDEGGTTASLILETTLGEQELLAFYGDISYPPAKKGQTVTLSASPLDGASLTALDKAGLHRDGCSYWFVYIYSK